MTQYPVIGTSRTSGLPIYRVTLADLEQAPGWHRSGGQWRGACILHGGNNTGAMVADLDKGLVYCHSHQCVAWIEGYGDFDQSGDWRDRLGQRHSSGPRPSLPVSRRPTSPPLPDPAHVARVITARAGLQHHVDQARDRLAAASESHPARRELARRHIPLDLALRYGVGLGGHTGNLAGRLVFPLSLPDGTITSATGRDLAGRPGVPKYRALPMAKGYDKGWFNAGVILPALAADTPVVVTEGPMDALAAITAGIPNVVAILGTHDQADRAAWLADTQVVLALDADKAGQDALHAFGGNLFYRHFARVSYVHADELAGHKDLSDFWSTRRAMPPTLADLLPPAMGDVDADGLSIGPLDLDIVLTEARR